MKHFAEALFALIFLINSPCYGQPTTGRFTDDVLTRWLPNGRDMELVEPFKYIDAGGTEWSVPKGAIVDGASIPRPLWSMIGSPLSGKYRKASVVHDYFCKTMSRPWQDVHKVFFEASLVEGNSLFHSKLMYGAVYAWGPRWQLLDGKPVRTRDGVRPPTQGEVQGLADWIRQDDPSLSDIAKYVHAHFPRGSTTAERRVALVIGNSAYQNAPKLLNPRNDAADMAETLRALGYEVIEGFDLDKQALDRIIHHFARALRDADAALLFYAGHGLQVGGQNYLVPIDATLEDPSGLDFETVRLDLIHRAMERATRTNVIFLDACRDNPLARNLARALGTRSVGAARGLAAVESGYGTLISFSTQPGNVALDGTGRNSPFAEALVRRIRLHAASEDLSRLLIAVRNVVMAATKNKQVPWENSALTKPFYFAPPSADRLPEGTGRPDKPKYDKEMEHAFWTTVKDTKSVTLIQRYLDRYPDGHFAPLAQALIEHLQKEQSAKDAVARGEAQAKAAENAQRDAAAKQEEEQRRVEAAKHADELARARDSAREAMEAMARAKAEQHAALRAAEEAKREADHAKLEQQRVLKEAEHQAEAIAAASARDAQTKKKKTEHPRLADVEAQRPDVASQSSSASRRIITTGADKLKSDNFTAIKGKRIGIITNQTAMVGAEHLVDLLTRAEDVKLAAILVPEHGFLGRAEAGEIVPNRVDKVTGVPIYSLYGKTRKATPEMLKGIDLVIFDIQDIGARFYTYISTLGLAMQTAAAARIPFLVLDRPNPLGGEYVSGFVLEDNRRSFVGQYNIPIAHGMTVGELAQMIQKEALLPDLKGLDLSVIPMSGWERWMRWPDTKEVWIPTSPNINTYNAALLYAGIGLFEATSMNEGRGTEFPFALLGADWVDQSDIITRLNAQNLPGVAFEAAQFTPLSIKGKVSHPRFEGKTLNGVRIVVTDYKIFAPVETGVVALQLFRDQARLKQRPELVEQVDWLSRLAGTKRLYEQLSRRINSKDIIASWKDEVERFKVMRSPHLLYR